MWNGESLPLETCFKGPVIASECYHGNNRRLRVPCGKIETCDFCGNAWRKRIRQRIYKGADKVYGGRIWKFVTLTMCPHTRLKEGLCVLCGGEKEKDKVEALLLAWKRYRKWLWRVYPGSRSYRVFEIGKKGAMHVHAVTNADLVTIKKADASGERMYDYLERQSEEGREYIGSVVRCGFGPITDVQKVNHGAGAVGAYLSKYLAKSNSKVIRRSDGRSIRVAEGTRNWLDQGRTPNFFWSEGRYTEGIEEKSGCDCELANTEVNPVTRKIQRREARDAWLVGCAAVSADCRRLVRESKDVVRAVGAVTRKVYEEETVGRKGTSEEVYIAKAAYRETKEKIREVTAAPLGYIREYVRELENGH